MHYENKGNLDSYAGREEIKEKLRHHSSAQLLSDYSLNASDRKAIRQAAGISENQSLSQEMENWSAAGPGIGILIAAAIAYKMFQEYWEVILGGALFLIVVMAFFAYRRHKRNSFIDKFNSEVERGAARSSGTVSPGPSGVKNLDHKSEDPIERYMRRIRESDLTQGMIEALQEGENFSLMLGVTQGFLKQQPEGVRNLFTEETVGIGDGEKYLEELHGSAGSLIQAMLMLSARDRSWKTIPVKDKLLIRLHFDLLPVSQGKVESTPELNRVCRMLDDWMNSKYPDLV